ncbi:MAG: YciI family protein [Vulcanimicrobiaceae bacterium]
MFILLSRYVKPLADVDAALEDHRAFLTRMYERGVFLASGPLVPRMGGVILANAASRSEVEAILREDPFTQRGVSEYEILEFTPNRSTPAFAALLQ